MLVQTVEKNMIEPVESALFSAFQSSILILPPPPARG